MTATATATPELKIEPKLPVLSFNFEQLKAWATSLTERYANMVVTEEAIADVKRDMADINRAKKIVDDSRKEAVRRVSEPIRIFEGQIKEVCAIFDTAYSKLGEQVKTFEDTQREEKRNNVLELIGQCFADAFGAHGDWPDFDIPIQEKWLNKTTSMKSIREDIAAIIQRHIEEEQRKASLEQARQDRAAAIENHVKALNQLHGLNLSLSRYLGTGNLDMSIPLSRVLENIEGHFHWLGQEQITVTQELTQKEKAEYAEEMAAASGEKDRLEAELDGIKKQYKRLIDAEDSKISTAAKIVREGKEEREIFCDKLADHNYARDGGICMKCGKKVTEKAFHIDHIIPLAAGGDEWDLNNLELSCPRCNIVKGAKLDG